MRSGQYKLSGPKTKDDSGGSGISGGHFRPSCKELPPLSVFLQSGEHFQLDLNDLKDLNCLGLASLMQEEGGNLKGRETFLKHYKEHLLKGGRRKESILRHRSCENVNVLPRGAVNRVEQKVRSLLLRGEGKRRPDVFSHVETLEEGGFRGDLWQAGKIVTMQRKPRLTGAHSHSALHTLSASSDTASCLSASSGYSSSSSSSYGSFKSSASVNSTLPRHRNNSSGNQSPENHNNGRILFVDNPLYDFTPSAASRLYDASRFCETTGLESLSSGEYSLSCDGFSPPATGFISPTSGLTSPVQESLPFQDPVAKECKEYFLKRLQTSENFRKKLLSTGSRSPKIEFERDKNVDSELISKGDAVIDSKFNIGFGSDLSFVGVESNFMASEDFGISNSFHRYENKNQLDQKMEFLRQEIVSLIQQDHSLFQQFISLHDSISSLRLQNAHPRPHSIRPNEHSDLDSFTEEEEDGEAEEVMDEELDVGRGVGSLEEGGNKFDSEEKTFLSREEGVFRPRDSPKDLIDTADEEDEGHCTDLSLGHTPSHSPSPASTLSSNSSKDSSYSRSLCSDTASDCSGSFTRCRKSYAPNARNRRRASSVHGQKPSPLQLDCGTTTALVVVHADDEDAILNSNRQRSHSFTPLSVFASHDALSYTQANNAQKALLHYNSLQGNCKCESGTQPQPSSKFNSKSNLKDGNQKLQRSKMPMSSCSSQTVTSPPRPNLTHPPYREALIM